MTDLQWLLVAPSIIPPAPPRPLGKRKRGTPPTAPPAHVAVQPNIVDALRATRLLPRALSVVNKPVTGVLPRTRSRQLNVRRHFGWGFKRGRRPTSALTHQEGRLDSNGEPRRPASSGMEFNPRQVGEWQSANSYRNGCGFSAANRRT